MSISAFQFGYKDENRVVFRETFTGDGSDTTFQLTSSIGNAVFLHGQWEVAHVVYTLPSHITGTDKKSIYDSANILTRTRIEVSSIDATGLVTLSLAPMNGVNFYVWYWYDLEADVLSDYYREDFVASMEDAGGALLASSLTTNTAAFGGLLSVADDTVQKALDTLDDITHSDLPDLDHDDHTQYLLVAGTRPLTASAYVNWGATSGETGYGFRDNAGRLEFKHSGEDWAEIGTGTDNPLVVGEDDTTVGSIYVYGGGAGADGGVLRWYLGADDDAAISYFSGQVVEDDFVLGPDTDPDALKLSADKDLFVTAGTISCSDLTDGYVPYHVSDAAGLANSALFYDGTNTGVGIFASLAGILHVKGGGINTGGGVVIDTGLTSKGVFQALNASGQFLFFVGSNLYSDAALATQRFDTSQIAWSYNLDARSSIDSIYFNHLTAAGAMTRPFMVTGTGTVAIGNLTNPPALTGAVWYTTSDGNMTVAGSAAIGGTDYSKGKLQVAGRVTCGGSAIGGDILTIAGSTYDGAFQIWKDNTPTIAWSSGLSVPGTALTNDLVFSSWSPTPWTERMRLTTTGLQIGRDDAAVGALYCYGGGAGADGGVLRLYLGADDDTTIQYFAAQIVEDDLLIGPDTDTDALKLDAAKNLYLTDGDLYVQAAGTSKIQLLSTNSRIDVGVNDTDYGSIYLYGHATGSAVGGVLNLYLAADHDTTISYFTIQGYEDDLFIGPNTDTDALKLDSNKDFYITAGSLVLPASEYVNFGDTFGSGGYGVRDNAGIIEAKSSGGAWDHVSDSSGWISANESWSYDSSTTITVPSGATAKYQKGMKIKLTQSSTVKYFYIVAVADTVLTVVGNAAGTVANDAISANYYSRVLSPKGFPTVFTWVPGFTGFSTNPTVSNASFFIVNQMCYITYTQNALGTSNANTFTITGLPVAAAAAASFVFWGVGANNSANIATVRGRISSTTLTLGSTIDQDNVWTTSGTKGVYYFAFGYVY